MQLLAILFPVTALVSAILADQIGPGSPSNPPPPMNNSREYHLRTCLKANEPGKKRFENLYLQRYSVDGINADAVFVPKSTGNLASLWLTNPTKNFYGNTAYDLAIDPANGNIPNPFFMFLDAPGTQNIEVDASDFYGHWQNVGIFFNSPYGPPPGGISGGYFINQTGLQFSAVQHQLFPSFFGGWLGTWYHNLPQLFWRVNFFPEAIAPTPASCADVYLYPEYI